MTDHDTTIREAVQYRDALTSDEVITVQIKSTAKPLVPVDPDKLSGMLEALLAVIEQQQATIDRQAETLRQVRELAEDMKGCPDKYGYGKLATISGWDAAMDQVMIRLEQTSNTTNG